MNLMPTDVVGTAKFKRKFYILLHEFRAVSRTLACIPANVTLMYLDIDLEQWERSAGQLPTGLMTSAMEENGRQVKTTISYNVACCLNKPFPSITFKSETRTKVALNDWFQKTELL